MDILMTRRSIRKYRPDPVKEEDLDYILRAAMAAPSAHNSQGWAFIVVTDRPTLDHLAEKHPYGKMLFEAPAAIVVCGLAEIVQRNPFLPQDLGATTMAILLAAKNRGLGTCWCGVHPKPTLEKMVCNVLDIPEEAFPFALVALGYPAEDHNPSERFNATRVHKNKW